MPKVFRNFLQPENPLSTKVAILGPANAGKSTLLNRFVESQVLLVLVFGLRKKRFRSSRHALKPPANEHRAS